MKRLIACLLLVVSVFALGSCGGEEEVDGHLPPALLADSVEPIEIGETGSDYYGNFEVTVSEFGIPSGWQTYRCNAEIKVTAPEACTVSCSDIYLIYKDTYKYECDYFYYNGSMAITSYDYEDYDHSVDFLPLTAHDLDIRFPTDIPEEVYNNTENSLILSVFGVKYRIR